MTVDLKADLFDVMPCEGVVPGHCVFMRQDDEGFEIVFAGPFNSAPPCAGVLMFLNPLDFERLKKITERKRN